MTACRALLGLLTQMAVALPAVTSQIPGAALIQAKGVKPVLGLTMVGTCGTFFLLPWLARLGATGTTAGVNVRIMAACLTVCGFCQGPLIPGQMTLRRSWLPKLGSPERPIHTKLMQLGAQFAGVLTAAAIPWTATRFGWASINRLAGGSGLAIAAVWFAKAAATPADYLPEFAAAAGIVQYRAKGTPLRVCGFACERVQGNRSLFANFGR